MNSRRLLAVLALSLTAASAVASPASARDSVKVRADFTLIKECPARAGLLTNTAVARSRADLKLIRECLADLGAGSVLDANGVAGKRASSKGRRRARKPAARKRAKVTLIRERPVGAGRLVDLNR